MYRDRLKLIHACIYFDDNCVEMGRTKLYKLLFLFDFETYRLLGRSVTGLDYYAWENGPVPKELDREWKSSLGPDMAQALRPVSQDRLYDFENPEAVRYPTKRLVPKVPFERKLFSDKEFELMSAIAKKFFKHTGAEMTLETHADFGYWDEVWNQRNEHFENIPYELVFDRQNTPRDKVIREYAKERKRLAQLSE